MLQRKPLLWFLILTFAISWPLFLIPLAYKGNPATYQQIAVLCWTLAMWGPGVAAILTTLLVARRPFSDLRLNKLGKFRIYVIAWFLPPLLAALAVGLTALIGTGTLVPNFTTMQQIADQAARASGQSMPVTLLIIIQLAQGLILGPVINVFATMGEELGWRGFGADLHWAPFRRAHGAARAAGTRRCFRGSLGEPRGRAAPDLRQGAAARALSRRAHRLHPGVRPGARRVRVGDRHRGTNMPMKSEITPLLIMIKLEQYDYAGATAIALVFLVASFAMLLVVNALSRRRVRVRPAA